MNMKISELIAKLEKLKKKHGDLPVRVQTMDHNFSPEPVIREALSGPVVLLNP